MKRAGWGKNLICGAIQGWSLSITDTATIASEDARRQILAHFAERVKRHLGDKATKKWVRDQHAILSREERDRLAPASVVSHISRLAAPTMAVAVDDVELATTTAAVPQAAAAAAAAGPDSPTFSSSLFALSSFAEAPY